MLNLLPNVFIYASAFVGFICFSCWYLWEILSV